MKMSGFTITRERFAREYVIIDELGVNAGILATGNNNAIIEEGLANYSDNYDKTILVNLKAVHRVNVPKIMALFSDRDSIDLAELNEELPNGKKRSLTIVHKIILNKDRKSEPTLPLRDQKVTLNFFEKADKDGVVWINSSDMKVAPAIKPSAFVFEKIKENSEKLLSVNFAEDVVK